MFRLKEAKELSYLAKERGLTAKIHLALDTGMSRIGMAPVSYTHLDRDDLYFSRP